MVQTDTCIQNHPWSKILSEVDISCNFIHATISDFACSCTICNRFIPCMTTKVLEVDTCCSAVASKQLCTLIEWKSTHTVIVHIISCTWSTTCLISIVDLVVSPVIVCTESTACKAIIVGKWNSSQTTGDLHIIVEHWSTLFTWVWWIEVSDIYIPR